MIIPWFDIAGTDFGDWQDENVDIASGGLAVKAIDKAYHHDSAVAAVVL